MIFLTFFLSLFLLTPTEQKFKKKKSEKLDKNWKNIFVGNLFQESSSTERFKP